MGLQDLADAADARWFQRETEREARLEEARPDRAEKVDGDVERRLFGSSGKEAKTLRMYVAELHPPPA